jgi:hypothetical protein
LQKKLPSQVVDPVDTDAGGGCCIGVYVVAVDVLLKMGSCESCQVVEYTAARMRFRTRSNWPLSGSCVGAAVVLGCAAVVVDVVVVTVVATVVVDVSVVGRIDVTHAPLLVVLLSVPFNARVTQPLLLLLPSVAFG